ncbi:MAG: alkaline phosphatase D family protein [Myxococcota bacterium]
MSRIVVQDPPPLVSGPRLRSAVSRREFVRLLSGLGVGGLALGATPWPLGCAALDVAFPEGVICGDPRPDGAVIWTRAFAADPGRPLNMLWVVAEDPDLQQVVAGGVARAQPGSANSVHVPVQGLDPDRWYHYGFFSGDGASPVGRLRTAPAPGSQPDRLRYAFASCQQRNDSFYVAHRAIAGEDIDFLMHLGDYIYVSDGGDITLDDYRRRWAAFKSNPLLQQMQASVPLVAMFDDGEFYNGVDRTGDPDRLAAARTAWFENMPIVRPADDRAHRAFDWGDLASVFMIDVRSYRDPEVPPNEFGVFFGLDIQNTQKPGVEAMFAEGRTTLGAEQKRWLLDGMEERSDAWKLIGNPYNINPWRTLDADPGPAARPADPDFQINGGAYVSNEAWDDYQAERREILEEFAARGIGDVVFSSAHTHFFIASELMADFDDPASPSAAVDFVSGSLTADPDPRTLAPVETLRIGEELFRLNNAPYMKGIDLVEQGYVIVEVTPEETLVDFRGIDTFDENAEPYTFARYRVARGSSTIEVLPVE